MNFNKISHNLLTKFSFAQSNIFSLITFSKLNVRKQLNRIKFIRSKITNKRGKKNKLIAKKYLSLLKLNAFNFSKKKKILG
jgi:hypothetical protein